MKLVLASKNAHKLVEMKDILSQLGVEVVLESEAGVDVDVEETGATFEENALLKAKTVMEATGLPAIADDSGLCVDALGGAPGVYSARFCGRHGDDKANNALLLEKLRGVPEQRRGAYFESCVAVCFPDGREITASGRTYGSILEEEAGEGGFGYDPLFESAELGKSFGLASAEEKNAVSHRGKALRALAEKLKEL